MKWIFSVEEKEVQTVTSVPELSEKEKVPAEENYKDRTGKISSKTKPVKTGDDTNLWLFILLGGTAFLVCCFTIRKGGKKE